MIGVSNNPFRIAIVGGIAVGKSTIINKLYQSIAGCVLIEEDVKDNIFLSDFYDDMKKWAFHSRISTLTMIANNYLQIPNEPLPKVVLMDRCIDELITFAQLHYDKGNLSDKEFAVYKMLYESVVRLAPPIDLFIYAYCSAEKSMERIKKRNRPFEQGITIEYINTLNCYYESWIGSIEPQKVISMNTNDSVPSSEIAEIIKNVIEHNV